MPKNYPSSGKQVESKIVEAVGVVSTSKVPGLGKRIEEAMAAAVEKAFKDGITDPKEQKKLMLAARQKVKDDFAAELEKARLDRERELFAGSSNQSEE